MPEYFLDEHGSCDHVYTVPALLEELRGAAKKRIFDLGCGNGIVAGTLCRRGFEVSGIDASTLGVEVWKTTAPQAHLELGSVYDDLAARFGTFPIVVCMEVVEHLYDPHAWAATLFKLLEPGGTAFITTPYHGYIKNLAVCATGNFDKHFNPLWDCGHIKFFSKKTLSKLLNEAGLTEIRFRMLGRVPLLAKSMMVVARKPMEPAAPPTRDR